MILVHTFSNDKINGKTNKLIKSYKTLIYFILVKGCESISEIPIIYDTSFEEIETVTIRQNIPIIVIDAMFNWSILNEFTLDNLTEVSISVLTKVIFKIMN